mgnify:CR=1 FL=1
MGMAPHTRKTYTAGDEPMTTTDLSTSFLLIRKMFAENATQGPWLTNDRNTNTPFDISIQNGTCFCQIVWGTKRQDITHIAANDPPTVIATIDELLRLREENERLEKELESARNWATSQHEVAKMAWGGEIPSPLPGHTHMTEEEACAMFEHLNCPWCGGSGHFGDCEEADQQVKAKLERLEKEADWLAERLAKYCVDDAEKECPLIDVCPEGSCPTITTSSWREAARGAVEE